MTLRTPAPTTSQEQAFRLWPVAKKRALKRKTLTHAEASAAVDGLPLEVVLQAAWPMHVWCWVRGMPPLNIVIVKRGTTADPEGGFDATDYDIVHEAIGHTVYTLEHAWHYPWEKVPDPTPEQLAWAVAVHGRHRQLLSDFRFLDLELELRQRDEARGRKRPAPGKHADWKGAESAHRALVVQLRAVGIEDRDLRPPGKGPYPPPRPIIGNWAD